MSNRHNGLSILLGRRAERRSRTWIEAQLKATITRAELRQARQLALQLA